MVYLKKKLEDPNKIVYMYGGEKDIYKGEIAIDLNDYSKPPLFYIYDFNDNIVLTKDINYEMKQAVFGMLNFIKTKEFPNEYLRVTH